MRILFSARDLIGDTKMTIPTPLPFPLLPTPAGVLIYKLLTRFFSLGKLSSLAYFLLDLKSEPEIFIFVI